jgi:hypothetical protein
MINIEGKNFSSGVRVSFAEPRIRVLSVDLTNANQLAIQAEVPVDIPSGPAHFFVVNPDESEAEASITIEANTLAVTSPAGPKVSSGNTTPREKSSAQTIQSGGAATVDEESPIDAGASSVPSARASNPATGTSSSKAVATSQARSFEVYNLGELGGILKRTTDKGTLALSKGKLVYTEGSKEVFSTKTSDIQEVGPNAVLGVNTGTFHVLLKSGKSYNFVAGSLKASDSLSIVDALRGSLK